LRTYVDYDTHPDPKYGTLYYRVKLVDQDGSSAYSELRSVTMPWQGRPSLLLYPNPASGWPRSVTVELLGEADLKPGELRLVNALGQVAWAGHWGGAHSVLELDLGTLPAGAYVLGLRTAKGWVTQKLLLQ
jgi:hypothetical protein